MKRIIDMFFKVAAGGAGIGFLIMAFKAKTSSGDIKAYSQALTLGFFTLGFWLLSLVRTYIYKGQLVASMEDIASGNLAKKVSGHGEYAVIGRAAAAINKNTKSILSETSEMAQTIMSLSADINETIRQEEIATNQIATSIHEMAQGTNEQLEATLRIRDNMNEILLNSENINNNSDSTLLLAHEMSEVVGKNTEVFGYVIDKLRSNAESNERILHRIEDLQKEAKKINEITNAVTEISDKTNILSLNASIEAARAGEHGRGFAVVAEEVRNLAQQSAGEAKQIKAIVDSINIAIREIADDSRSSFSNIQGDIEYADKSKQSSELMVESAGKTYESIEKIKQNSSSTYDIISSTTSLFDQITETTRKSAAFSEQVSAATQEQAASMTNSLEIVKNLMGMAAKSEEGIKAHISKIVITDKMKKDISGAFSVLEAIASEISSKNADIGTFSERLKFFKEREDMAEYIGILDRKGYMVSAADPIDKSNNMYGHRPYFMEAIKGNRFQSEPYISNVTFGYCIAIAIPYKKPDGRIDGVIMADISLEG